MSFVSLPGALRVLRAALAGLLVVLACTPYDFVPNEVAHCRNRTQDVELGETDLDCGGPNCTGCKYGQRCGGASDCSEGLCIEEFCQEPGCYNLAKDGLETGVDCGGYCAGCGDGQPCSVATDCASKVCEAEVCLAATCEDGVRNGDELGTDCGGSACDGCGIGAPCVVAADCQSASCDEQTMTCALNCTRGTDECDGDYDNPCETNLLTSSRNCGECGRVCNLAHAAAICIGGVCQIDDCSEPWIRCNTDDADGCEVNASTDVMNCGACGMECPALHGDPDCVGARCTIDCHDGFGDCDENALTGCETSVNDVENCGACDRACPADEGEPYCVDGECGFTDCEDGRGDCNGDQVCESNLDDDRNNCGRCGRICSAANGRADCVDGACVIVACDDGWRNCDEDDPDGGLSDGCETNLASDPRNCGACGQRCDVVANGVGTCQAGACDLVCESGFRDCDGALTNGCEADTRSDPDNCGGCDNECEIPNARVACSDSTCVIDGCLNDFGDCNAAEGCETNTSSSIQHCGGCNRACSRAGASAASCSAGRCDPPACDAEHRNCDGNNDNGCEADITTPAQCGACGNACDAATPNCVRTGNTYGCQAKITIANALPYPTAQTAASTLSFQAKRHAGTNRLALLAIASESQGNGLAGARPDSVVFDGRPMLAGPSQIGANDYWSPDIFIYYLPLGDAAAAEPDAAVTINGSSAPAMTAIIMQNFQLNGARQENPITDFDGAYLGTATPDAPDPSVSGLPLDITVGGSVIYSFMVAMWMDGGGCTAGTPSSNCPTWSVSPATNLTVTETLATSPLTIGGAAPMRAFAMFVTAPSSSLPAAGTYTPTWSIPYSGRMTHVAVAIAPAQQ